MKSPESTPTGPRKRRWVHSKEAVFWRHVKPYPLQQACCLRTITVSLSKVYVILLSSLTLYFIFYCLCFNMSPHILTQQTSVNPFRWPHHTTQGNWVSLWVTTLLELLGIQPAQLSWVTLLVTIPEPIANENTPVPLPAQSRCTL